MDRHLSAICQSPLFHGIQPDEVEAMLRCLDARQRTYAKGSTVFHAGSATTCMGLVLEGAVRLENVDYWGNRTIRASAGPGQTFAEVYACEPGLLLDVNVVAAADATVLLMDVGKITTLCSSNCAFHATLIRNLLGAVAQRAYTLTRKIEHVSKRTTRAKLLSYLSDQARSADSPRFAIPYDRQELADYLSVERSAMCAELSRMRKDGIIDYQRNQFELMQRSPL
ncbi:Crp/Fnr family transcriptional regulator [Gordonibacter sp.]|uniref:Crp/Fnr family transcriptional regulator n=1 Tax=Gordonibacter sp. TaxID=1968902 RepID=UPI002FCC6819